MHTKQKLVTIAISGVVILYFVLYFTLVINTVPGIAKVLLGVVPLALAYGMMKVCIERLDEIEGGEDDDLSQY